MIMTAESVEEFAVEGNDEEALSLLEEEVLYSLEKYLSSAVFCDVGPVTARRVVSHFGIRTPQVIEYSHKKLQEVNGVGPKRMLAIQAGWSYQKSLIGKSTQLMMQRGECPVHISAENNAAERSRG